MTIGIYKITNKKTGQMYIGKSINIEKRFKEHIRGNGCPYSYIDNAIQKYGKENFNFEIITQLPNNKKLLNTHEKYWIKFYNTYKDNFHYNLTIGGDGAGSGENHPMYGKHHSEETKKKISEANSGENHYFFGKYHSEETKRKLSEANSGENHPMYGKHHSEESKKKIKEANKGKYNGKNNPMYGKHHSEETKKKMSEIKTGENHPFYGQHHSEETKKKMSDAQIKKYARIIKAGEQNNKQRYAIKYQGKKIKHSISIDKLYKWFFENYPLEIIKTYKENS